MRETCGHVCHKSSYECEPCWRLHTLVERMTETLNDAVRAAHGAADRHPSIRSSMRMVAYEVALLASQFELMHKMGEIASETTNQALNRAGFPLTV